MKADYEIWTHELTKIYDKRSNQIVAVDHINLTVESGIHGFLGPNGAGKTTTMNMLIGAISITEGEAFIRGKKACLRETRRMIGFLPQDPAFYSNMTAYQYLMYAANLYGVNKVKAEKEITELLEFFELNDNQDKIISKYSGGMKQKVGLASALIHRPKLLILDEPTTNLDPMGRKNIIDYVKKLSNDMSIFVSSHILSEIEQMCKTVTIIDKGKFILTDKIQNIKNAYSTVKNVFILDTNANELVLKELKNIDSIQKVWIDTEDSKVHIIHEDKEKLQVIISKFILNHDIIIKSFHQPEVTLQDVFINFTKKSTK